MGEFDAKFIDIDNLETIFDIIMAANYLDIKSLLDLSCAKIATLIRGKTPEEIRKTFNIVNDFTPEEEAQIREENKWAEDFYWYKLCLFFDEYCMNIFNWKSFYILCRTGWD